MTVVFFLLMRGPLCLITLALKKQISNIKPFIMKGLAHHYYLGELHIKFRGIKSIIRFLFYFLMTFLLANRIAQDGTPLSSVPHLGYTVSNSSIYRTPGPSCSTLTTSLVNDS